jgi:hypothetical protein
MNGTHAHVWLNAMIDDTHAHVWLNAWINHSHAHLFFNESILLQLVEDILNTQARTAHVRTAEEHMSERMSTCEISVCAGVDVRPK